MFRHASLGASDIRRAIAFYDALRSPPGQRGG